MLIRVSVLATHGSSWPFWDGKNDPREGGGSAPVRVAWRGWPLLLVWLLVAGACQAQQAQSPTPTVEPTATQVPPTPTSRPIQPSPTPTPEPNIVLTAPAAGASVASPFRVTGRARVFEAALMVALYDGQDRELFRKPVMASAGGPEWGTFAVELTFPMPERQGPGHIEALSHSPRDGSVINRTVVPVVLAARGPGSAPPAATAASAPR